LTSPSYVFDESQPFCFYPETVTITGLPTFMKHNKLTAKFTIAQTFNLALIGMYTLTIRSEINVPNDYTMTTSRVMFVEEIVNVFV